MAACFSMEVHLTLALAPAPGLRREELDEVPAPTAYVDGKDPADGSGAPTSTAVRPPGTGITANTRPPA